MVGLKHALPFPPGVPHRAPRRGHIQPEPGAGPRGQVGAHLMRFCRPCLLEFLRRIALVMVAEPRRAGSRCRPLPSAAGSRPALRAPAAPSPPSGSSAAGFLLFLLAPPAPHPRLASSTSTSSSSSPSASWKCHGRISGSAAAGGPRSTKPGAPHSPARGILSWL